MDNKASSTKEDVIQKPKDSRDSVCIPDEYGSYRDDFITIFEPIASMSDGHSGDESTLKRRTDLQSSVVRPVDSVPYHAGPKAHDLEKSKINNMLAMSVIESSLNK